MSDRSHIAPVDDDEALDIVVIDAPSHLERRLERLTPAEADVARLLLEGLCNRQIAARRGCSVRTIDGQVHDIFTCYDVHDRGELAWALVGPDEPRLPRQARRCSRR
jgi:DNA-binding NarL/FixJ family response regulator